MSDRKRKVKVKLLCKCGKPIWGEGWNPKTGQRFYSHIDDNQEKHDDGSWVLPVDVDDYELKPNEVWAVSWEACVRKAEKGEKITFTPLAIQRLETGIREIKALLAEKDAALESLKAELALWRSEHDPCPFSIELEALKARAMQAEKERDDYEFASAEWSTVANWRSAQVNSAKAAGIEFTEPGITCKNVRAGQWEKIATDYRNYHGDAPRSCSLFNSGDKRCDSCKAYDALSESREGEQG